MLNVSIICSAFEDNAASNENAKARGNGLDRTSGAHFPALPLVKSVFKNCAWLCNCHHLPLIQQTLNSGGILLLIFSLSWIIKQSAIFNISHKNFSLIQVKKDYVSPFTITHQKMQVFPSHL